MNCTWTIGYTDRAENVIKADTIELADDGYAIFRDSEDGVVHVVARQSFSYATRTCEADDETRMPSADELINHGIKLVDDLYEDARIAYSKFLFDNGHADHAPRITYKER